MLAANDDDCHCIRLPLHTPLLRQASPDCPRTSVKPSESQAPRTAFCSASIRQHQVLFLKCLLQFARQDSRQLRRTNYGPVTGGGVTGGGEIQSSAVKTAFQQLEAGCIWPLNPDIWPLNPDIWKSIRKSGTQSAHRIRDPFRRLPAVFEISAISVQDTSNSGPVRSNLQDSEPDLVFATNPGE